MDPRHRAERMRDWFAALEAETWPEQEHLLACSGHPRVLVDAALHVTLARLRSQYRTSRDVLRANGRTRDADHALINQILGPSSAGTLLAWRIREAALWRRLQELGGFPHDGGGARWTSRD